ncbi:hypothetical protein HPB48_015610 [Haemaphysalis longicornis]|uniref:Di19 zinc-binding domain-containing protein n=1 Tax=Haemaphysalis longicornis TaxID=44386 RepID=A0A9J6FKF9_HAELO|nr:hypothetical protein HPB48_015610 [Haemaphysalis longicornis]
MRGVSGVFRTPEALVRPALSRDADMNSSSDCRNAVRGEGSFRRISAYSALHCANLNSGETSAEFASVRALLAFDFCSGCLAQCKQDDPKCPLCRSIFDPSKTLSLSKLRAHHSSCTDEVEGAAAAPPVYQPPHSASKENRVTFPCPYCETDNLDLPSLRDHCNANHYNNPRSVVCPVCASMPWGNPHQKSINFLSHLNLRHRFEYDTYVDYGIDDDDALQQALEASLKEK